MTNAERFKKYRRSQVAHLRPWVQGDDMSGISISEVDRQAGSPKHGDMIARNPKNHADQWLVAAQYFADNFEPVSSEAAEVFGQVELAKAGSGWQSIESAPKDGTRILVVTHTLVEVAKWGTSNCWIAENGRVSLAASHWQPLPSPPPEQPNG